MSDQTACAPLRKRLKTIESIPVTEGSRREIVNGNPREDINREWQEKLRKLLLCPVCYVTIRPSVNICKNGHSVCNECWKRLHRCPLCCADFTEIRNLMLAQIADYVRYPCLNVKGGCSEMYYLREEKSHLRGCVYRIHECKIHGCRWQGLKKDLRIHVDIHHRESVWERDWCFSETSELDLRYSSSAQKFLVVHNEIFWIYLKYNSIDKTLYRNILYIGTKDMAEKFSYQVCLKSSDDRRGYRFKSVMDDDAANGDSVFDSPTCATIVLRCFSLSSNQQMSLECHYSLKKC